ncbi:MULTISPECIES: class III lanthionine synthetase LanKC [Streptomyces]|uniref:class III lanthionine synthetase LanKC n=1 Tax=Streptomyces TaxID=1883 RepID=UPI000FFF3249|nr:MULTISPECIES: class III lanthionine synthetase LanKC [Streptomyces]
MDDYLRYCQPGADFYDRPAADAQERFGLTGRPAPEGWTLSHDDVWSHFAPEGHELPEQGWKVHVSVVPREAAEVIEIAAAYCFERRIAFKVLLGPAAHRRLNSKYAPRGGSGKLITVYPLDDTELKGVLDELSVLLEGREGPYVLSDLRWRRGPLYVRFGGFRRMHTVDGKGRRVLAVRTPDGTLVPDPRGPGFRPPEWVEIPAFLRGQMTAAAVAGQAGPPMPYTVRRALHFSNGGGIYLAEDPATGGRVVLREARPHAGIDGRGDDAVTRLYREARTLEALGDLDFVPDFKGTFTVWEHHYLAQEYIEGTTLWEFLAARNPAARGAADRAAFADYTRTALGILDRLESALAALHARGYVFGDLHPRNVMVRPDGRIALVDFEIAHRPGLDPAPAIACPGYVAEHAGSGTDRDTYALDCVRMALFLPLTLMLDLDPGKTGELTDAVGELFPVPVELTRRIRTGLTRPGALDRTGPERIGPERDFTAAAGDLGGPAMRALMASLARAIHASATPERTDRLFPGDPKGLEDGGYNLAYGAAGVLYALRGAGLATDPGHARWLADALRRAPARPGLHTGFHGAALVLHGLGHEQEAYDALDRAAPETAATRSPGLESGLAGIALVLRHLARATGDPHWRDELDGVSTRLADRVDDAADDLRPGLLHGFTGAALFFLRRYADTGDDACLDHAGRALDRDLAHCRTDDAGEVQLADGARLLPYLGLGAAGLAEAVALYHRHRPDERLAALHRGILRACHAPFAVEPGLFMGRAGLITALAGAETRPVPLAQLARHVRRLSWHAVTRDGGPDGPPGIAFPGHRLLRLSMDLSNGTAGVLLALRACARAAGAPPAPVRPTVTESAWVEAAGLPYRASRPPEGAQDFRGRPAPDRPTHEEDSR